ncbi:hypothetical protein SAMN05421819_3596 [Bryocella elongata]|uniref:Uncharacterized protein n=1 Tax=Bryocella elongata TaxID=863522 RepID=A0A1H6B7I7_9BACT|nr:hypothetical protein [Bryocella elongata]SEG56821.1 hypothetical protein SAMN05421819_3596 [Bryocella elongata]
MGNYPSYYAYPSTPPLVRVLPNPPRLHWGWVLALHLLTRGLFGAVWLLVQANWVRKVRGSSKAFVWSIVNLAVWPVVIFAGAVIGVATTLLHVDPTESSAMLATFGVLVFLAVLILNLGTIFTLRSELEELPVGLSLGAIMTFFFGPIYFQYHLHTFSFDQVNTTPGYSLGLNAAPLVVPVEQDKSL